jgi:hypothetical protein
MFTNRLQAEFKEGLVTAAVEIDSRLKNLISIVNIVFA